MKFPILRVEGEREEVLGGKGQTPFETGVMSVRRSHDGWGSRRKEGVGAAAEGEEEDSMDEDAAKIRLE